MISAEHVRMCFLGPFFVKDSLYLLRYGLSRSVGGRSHGSRARRSLGHERLLELAPIGVAARPQGYYQVDLMPLTQASTSGMGPWMGAVDKTKLFLLLPHNTWRQAWAPWLRSERTISFSRLKGVKMSLIAVSTRLRPLSSDGEVGVAASSSYP